MKKNKNLKLLRAWFSFLARYTRKKKSLWCMAAILLVIGIAAAQNALICGRTVQYAAFCAIRCTRVRWYRAKTA